MPFYKAPISEALFLINDVLDWHQFEHVPSIASLTPDLLSAILDESARFCENVLLPLNQIGDLEGCRRDADGQVFTPQGFKDAYNSYAQGGWGALSVPEEFGGQGLPHILKIMISEQLSSANMAFAMYPGLTAGALAALLEHGSQEQKRQFVPKMASGEWSGTMNLTESHCGTDLGLLKTKAVPQADGTYLISGQKIFISAGEHDLCENILHLVLARIEGAPQGTKGISLFLVPKINVDKDGNLQDRNDVSCGAIEHKMGIHGNSTCVMNYDGARGFLIGEPNRGLNAMFVMMNEARIGVAIQGLSQAEIAYQNAVIYAKDRLQGRSLAGVQAPEKPADPIIVHPDVRRNLLWIKAFTVAARGVLFEAALMVDAIPHEADEQRRATLADRLALLTPVLKGVFTDFGLESTIRAQQIFGGHGYIREWGMEQFVRDARITQIYEGANGIQALDLIGRKVPKNGGAAAFAYFKEILDFIKLHQGEPAMASYLELLKKSLADLQNATVWLGQNAVVKPQNAGSAAYDYMHLFGLVTLGYMWAKILRGVTAKPVEANGHGKIALAHFYAQTFLPETSARLARICAGADNVMALSADMF